MPKRTFTPEQMVGKLRQIEVLVGQGKTVPLACKESGITDQRFIGGGKNTADCRSSKRRSSRICKKKTHSSSALATLTLEKQVLKDIAEGNFQVPRGDVTPFNTHGTGE